MSRNLPRRDRKGMPIAKMPFKSDGRKRADGLHVADGFPLEKRQMPEMHFHRRDFAW